MVVQLGGGLNDPLLRFDRPLHRRKDVRDFLLLGEWGERESPLAENREVAVVTTTRNLQCQQRKVVKPRVVELFIRNENLGSVSPKYEREVDVFEAASVVAEYDQRQVEVDDLAFFIAITSNELLPLIDDREATDLCDLLRGNLVLPPDLILNERIGHGACLPLAHTPFFTRISFKALSVSHAGGRVFKPALVLLCGQECPPPVWVFQPAMQGTGKSPLLLATSVAAVI